MLLMLVARFGEHSNASMLGICCMQYLGFSAASTQRARTLREVRARATSCGACGCPGAVGTVEKLTAGDGGCGGMARYASENGSGVTRKAYMRPGRRLLICSAECRLKPSDA